MAAMKPRTSDGPLEVERTLHGYTLRLPLEGGGRMVLEMKREELEHLASVVTAALDEKK